jgi:hypothetical protein
MVSRPNHLDKLANSGYKVSSRYYQSRREEYTMRMTGILLTATLFCAGSAVWAGSSVPYPEGYRDWHHVKSMVILPGHPLENPFAGIHHVYANDTARAGLARGRFEAGSVLVFDLLEAVQGEHAITEGARKLVGVMVKDPKRFAATGGWGFEGFAGDSRERRLTDDGGQGCFDCHRQARERDFVFTRPRP